MKVINTFVEILKDEKQKVRIIFSERGSNEKTKY